MLIAIWNFLSNRFAYRFVGYVKTPNMIQDVVASTEHSVAESVDTKVVKVPEPFYMTRKLSPPVASLPFPFLPLKHDTPLAIEPSKASDFDSIVQSKPNDSGSDHMQDSSSKDALRIGGVIHFFT